MKRKIITLVSIGLLCICCIVLFMFNKNAEFSENMENNTTSHIVFSAAELHNGDAKFYNDKVITNVDGLLTMIDLDKNYMQKYETVYTNWIDSISEEGIIVYGNFNNQTGIVILDEDHELVSNNIIFETENLQIDPTIIKVNDMYYITTTEIVGTVNNDDSSVENGIYTIHLWKSEDLKQWFFVSDIVSENCNLEDVDIMYYDNHFMVVYERETIDKGPSSICLKYSMDSEGINWTDEIELLSADCDHEPVCFELSNDSEWRLYYSCDIDSPGESYMAGKIFYSTYNKDFELVKKNNEIPTETSEGILWYDINEKNGKVQYLFAKDYLTTCDLIVEEK